jgi:hypothetical protein
MTTAHASAPKKSSRSTSTVLRASQSAAFASAIQALRGIEASFDLATDISPDRRQTLARKVRYMPDAVLEGVAAVAAEHGGKLADVPLSADLVRETIARSAASASLVRALRAFAIRIENDAMARKGEVVDQVSAVLATLDGFVRTPYGAELAAAHRDLRAVLRSAHARRRARPVMKPPAVTPQTLPPRSTVLHRGPLPPGAGRSHLGRPFPAPAFLADAAFATDFPARLAPSSS